MRAERAERRAGTTESGFTLIEVIVALGLLMIVSLSVLPLMVKSMQAANAAKANTQAKNLLQERVEQMRNLPFHVPWSNGATYVDLLDIYFNDLLSPSTNAYCSTAAYTAATSTYTCTLDSAKLNFPGFTETVQAQFLDKDRNVIAPLATYDSQSNAGLDVPPAQMIGARITVAWTQYGKPQSYSTYTQVGTGAAEKPQTIAKTRNSAVSIDSTTDDALPATLARFDAGLITADAGVSTGATARATATGGYASFSSGETSSGQAIGSLDAPPDQTSFVTVSGSASGGVPCTTAVVCFGSTRVSDVTGKAAGGLPVVGTSSAPVTSSIVKSGSTGDRGYWFSNVPLGSVQSKLVNLKVQDAATPPSAASPTQLIRSVQGASNAGYSVACGATPTAISNADFVTSKAYIDTTGGSTHSVTACATSTARRLDIMPTSFAPDGVVQVTLHAASLSCFSNGAGSGAPVADWSATVTYWDDTIDAYVPLTVAKGTPDPLTAGLLTIGPGGVVVGTSPLGLPLYLGDFIKSWSSGSVNLGATSGAARQADLTAVSISTVPTRDADSTGQSSINVALGQLSCTAQDSR